MSATLEIRVSSKTQTNDLAGSITLAFLEGKEIILRAIGPVPVSQAFKAVAVANRHLASKGVMLAIIPGLVTEDIEDRDTGKLIPWVISLMRLRNINDNVRFLVACKDCGSAIEYDPKKLPCRMFCERCGQVYTAEVWNG